MLLVLANARNSTQVRRLLLNSTAADDDPALRRLQDEAGAVLSWRTASRRVVTAERL